MAAFSLGARLFLGANSRLAFSLPQSRCFNPFSPRQLPPQREPRRLPPQVAEFTLHSTGKPRSPLRSPCGVAAVGAVRSPLCFPRCSSCAQVVLKIFSQCSSRAHGAQIPISSAVLAPEELIQLSAADLALSRSKAMRAKRASRLSNFISGRTKESRNTKTFFP